VAKIAVVHVPFYSHIGAAMRLSSVLIRQGHTVVAWAPEVWREDVEACGATFELHHPDMPRVNGSIAFTADLAATVERLTGGLIEQLYAHEVDLLIQDSQVPWARVAADYLGIPRIISHPMFPIVAPHQIQSDASLRLPAPDPDRAMARFEASWMAIARRWGVELEGDKVIHSRGETTFTFTTREILGPDYELEPGWECIGPLMEPFPIAARLVDRPVVYVCLGTSFNGRTAPFRAVLDALEREPVDVLVSTGRGVLSAEDLEPLPENVEVHEFIPAREVLARASVHITHGGCNSVHESLLAGVPMLCIPQGFDQFPLTGRVEVLGAGRVVGEDPVAIREGVRWLLLDELPLRRTREIAEHLTAYDGERRVAEVIERVLNESAAVTA
jgi:MGT family glycosyltransferase